MYSQPHICSHLQTSTGPCSAGFLPNPVFPSLLTLPLLWCLLWLSRCSLWISLASCTVIATKAAPLLCLGAVVEWDGWRGRDVLLSSFQSSSACVRGDGSRAVQEALAALSGQSSADNSSHPYLGQRELDADCALCAGCWWLQHGVHHHCSSHHPSGPETPAPSHHQLPRPIVTCTQCGGLYLQV